MDLLNPSRATPSLIETLARSVRRFSDRPLFGTRRDGVWSWTTYGEFGLMVERLRSGLGVIGIEAGDRVAIIGANSLEWAACAYAALGAGAVYVPMYEQQQDADWEYILRDSGAKIVFVSKPEIAKRVGDLSGRLPNLRATIELAGPPSEPGNSTFTALLALGASEKPQPPRASRPDELAFLVYTSGTTGQPKGVMLSHGNLASNVAAVRELFPLDEHDRCLSFLPWAHAFGQTAELHTFISFGAAIGICEGQDKIVANLAEVRPTVLCSVPKIFNKIYLGVRQQIAAKPAPIRALFESAMKTAARQRNGLPTGPRQRLALFLADKIIFAKIRRKFGGQLRFAISGGAALAKEVGEFVDTLGIPVYEGYGLSETSPVISCNYPGARKLGSVGQPLTGVAVRIVPTDGNAPGEGEIVVSGPNVMLGYHDLPGENAAIFTPDGSLRTGDIGRLDEDGYLFITGRIKEQYKLENGKYIVPGPLEDQLKLSSLIANVLIYGDNRPYNVALVVPDREAVGKWSAERGHPLGEDWLDEPGVRMVLMQEFGRLTTGFKKCEQVRKISVIGEDFTQENGLLTPTLKLKRNLIVDKYRDLLETLYRH